jgi:hypothetical protein
VSGEAAVLAAADFGTSPRGIYKAKAVKKADPKYDFPRP